MPPRRRSFLARWRSITINNALSGWRTIYRTPSFPTAIQPRICRFRCSSLRATAAQRTLPNHQVRNTQHHIRDIITLATWGALRLKGGTIHNSNLFGDGFTHCVREPSLTLTRRSIGRHSSKKSTTMVMRNGSDGNKTRRQGMPSNCSLRPFPIWNMRELPRVN